MPTTAEEIMEFIDKATEPAAMPQTAALEILETLKDDIASRIEALKDEIAKDEDRD